MKPRSRQQRAMMAKPSRKAVQAAIAAQAPPGWVAPAREKRRAAKVEDEPVPELLGDGLED